MVECTDFPSQRTWKFYSQQGYDSLLPSVTPVQGMQCTLLASAGIRHTHVSQTYMQAKSHTHKIKINFKKVHGGLQSTVYPNAVT